MPQEALACRHRVRPELLLSGVIGLQQHRNPCMSVEQVRAERQS